MRRTRGVTLLELLVVLVIVGLTATLAAPALARSAKAEDARPPVERVIASARATAIRRSETLALDVAGGRYRLIAAYADSAPVASGLVDASSATRLRLLITPLGLCFGDAPIGADEAWDATDCRAASLAERVR